jgi:hypothetical protein
MPAPILTTMSSIMCPHGGQCVPVPSVPGIFLFGAQPLTVNDTFPIVGCTFNISGVPAPCLLVEWTLPAIGTTCRGVPVLLATSVGLCMGGSPGVPAIVSPGPVLIMGN